MINRKFINPDPNPNRLAHPPKRLMPLDAPAHLLARRKPNLNVPHPRETINKRNAFRMNAAPFSVYVIKLLSFAKPIFFIKHLGSSFRARAYAPKHCARLLFSCAP
jgi:hypothetical protein